MSSSVDSPLLNRLTLLLEVNAAISSTINLPELLRKIINLTSVVMQCEASSLALIDPLTDELVFQFAHGDATEVIETLRLPIGQGIAGWVAKYGVPLNIPDVEQDPRFYRQADEKSHFKTRSVLCVPLKRNDRIIGVLQALNHRSGEGGFSEEDYLLFESLSAITAISLENAQLYSTLNDKLGQLEVSNQRLESILAQLEKSEDEISKLQQAFGQRQMTGQLEIFRLENLLQMLSNDRKTGQLSITTADGSKGHIFLTDGRLDHAESYNGVLTGNDALFDLICWNCGTFVFNNTDVSHPKTVEGMTMGLVIEGLRRLDEYSSNKDKYPDDGIPYMVPFERTAYTPTFMARLSLTPTKTKVMSLIDGKRTFSTICREAGTDRYSVMMVIKDLQELNVVAIQKPDVA